MSAALRIEVDDVTRPEVIALLEEHLANMYEITPAEHVFALDVTKLRAPDITFWSVWDGETLVGCGALRELDATHGEVKSMRTPKALRRRGAGRAVLERIVATARERGYKVLSLETGSHPAFDPAQGLYRSFGFDYCGPFADYEENPSSVFMTLRLDAVRPELVEGPPVKVPRLFLVLLGIYFALDIAAGLLAGFPLMLIRSAVLAFIAWRAIRGSRPAALFLGALFAIGAIASAYGIFALYEEEPAAGVIQGIAAAFIASIAGYIFFSRKLKAFYQASSAAYWTHNGP